MGNLGKEILDKLGQMPLPPYITHELKDKNRYQTVYAAQDGSCAAPTAGLHFTKELLGQIEKKGVEIARVTLHVGLGTFRPVKVSHAFGVLPGGEGRSGKNQPGEAVWQKGDLCGYHQLQDFGVSYRGRRDFESWQWMDRYFHLSRIYV